MKKPEYMSYSSMTLFHEDPAQYYQRYLLDTRPARDPQTEAMAVGSAFDAYIKSYLFAKVVGRQDAKHELQYMFESQVEPARRDVARKDGKEVFDMYIASGAVVDLIESMKGCIGEPRFEDSITGLISVSGKEGAVPILGKPDIYFVTKDGARIIFDWKVNGFYSKTPPSPKVGYYRMYPGRSSHKDCMPGNHKGIGINTWRPMDMVDSGWAEQTSTYAWVLGEDVGSDFIAIIDQIVCNKNTKVHRVARHSAIVRSEHQHKTFDKYHTAWQAIQSEHIFRDLSYEDSKMKGQTIENLSKSIVEHDPVFDELTEVPRRNWR